MVEPVTVEQLSLLSEPRVRHDNPPTSVAAAESVRPNVDKLEAKILAVYETYGPCNDQELCTYMAPWHGPTVISARSRLKKRGLVVGDGVKRNTRDREMIVWRLP